MFRHVLVPVDLGGRHVRALETALELARRGRGRVTLIHVVHRIAHVADAELRDFYAQLERASQRRLDRAARRFVAAALPVRTEVVVGEPASVIARYAARHRADLIVMGIRRADPARPGAGWGTTSYKVSRLCRCPILLVK